MKILRHYPRTQKKWEIDGHGARIAHLYTDYGVIEVYSFPGDERSAPFTHLRMWIAPHVYFAKLPRAYHDRWIGRIAHAFGWKCLQASKQQVQS